MRKIIILISFLFLSCITVHAEDEWDFAMPHKNRCSEGGQQPMNICLGNEYRKVDAKLNSVYKSLIASLEDPSKLINAQKAWIRFRDLTCEYETSGIGKKGSLYPYAQAACLIDLTEKRIRDLKEYETWDCNGCPPRK